MVHAEKPHASVKLYWVFAGVLSVITFIEWFVFQTEYSTNAMVMVPLLIGLSLIKFTMVCGWYMHLRYDHPLLRQVYTASLILAIMVFTIVMLVI